MIPNQSLQDLNHPVLHREEEQRQNWAVKMGRNNHTYCAYQISQPINWFNAFSFGKQMGGYLVTMTNDAERIWVNTNIVASGTGYNLANNIWIGFNKIKRPGNPDQLQWITGEEFKINWSTNPAPQKTGSIQENPIIQEELKEPLTYSQVQSMQKGNGTISMGH
jgi:hypothetical protein